MTPTPLRKGEAVFATVLLASSLLLLREALAIGPLSRPSAPGGVPVVASGLMAAAALHVLIDALLRPRLTPESPNLQEQPLSAGALGVLALAVTLAAGFALLVYWLGFLLAGTLFLTLAFRLVGARPWRIALPVALAVVLVIWLLFRLAFQVLLPEGIVPERAILAAIEDWISARLGGSR